MVFCVYYAGTEGGVACFANKRIHTSCKTWGFHATCAMWGGGVPPAPPPLTLEHAASPAPANLFFPSVLPRQDGRFVQLGDHGKLLEQGTEVEVEVVQPPRKRASRQVGCLPWCTECFLREAGA